MTLYIRLKVFRLRFLGAIPRSVVSSAAAAVVFMMGSIYGFNVLSLSAADHVDKSSLLLFDILT